MNIEDLLRDAYRGAAETVKPESAPDLHIRRGQQLRQVRHQSSRHARMMIPLAAAASVAVVVVLSAVILPRLLNVSDAGRPSETASYPTYFVSLTVGPGPMSVNRASTGAFVTQIPAPRPGMSASAITVWGHQTFTAAFWRPGVCTTWLYRFRLNDRGRPTALAPLAVLRGRLLDSISASGNGQRIAYYGTQCGDPHGGANRSFLGILNVATGQTRQWVISGQTLPSLSLSANGLVLVYSYGPTPGPASSVKAMPTYGRPGPAIDRSITIVRASQFGRSTQVDSVVLTPDNGTLYFITSSTGDVRHWHPVWQLRATNLAGRHLRLVKAFGGFPGAIAADPVVRRLLITFTPAAAGPSPSPSPHTRKPTPSASPSARHVRTATPSASPSARHVRTATPSASPSPRHTGTPTPSPTPSARHTRTPNPSPSPSPTRSQQPTPTPSPSGEPQPIEQMIMIDASTGRLMYLPALPGTVISFAW